MRQFLFESISRGFLEMASNKLFVEEEDSRLEAGAEAGSSIETR